MKKKLVYPFAALAVIALLIAFARLGRGRESAIAPPATVAAARVRRADLARTITLSAEFRPFQEVSVHAKVAGYVRSIRVDVGDHVRRGDTIATLEIPELADDVHKAAAATQAAREELKRAQARHDELHLVAQRLQQVVLQRPNLVAQQDIDSARDQDMAGQASLDAARHSVEEGEANESRMQTMLGYGVITAPFDGVITRRYADTGALIQAGTSSNTQAMPVVSLAEDRLLRLAFPVPESAVPFVREGTTVQIEVLAVHRKFAGAVARLAGQVDRETRTMLTEVDVPNPDLGFTPGMYATVTLALDQRTNVLAVPVRAIAEGKALVVGADGKLEQRTVRIGLETPEDVEVLAGLNEGELVVAGARSLLRGGDRVVPKVEGATAGKEEQP
ncbi:MAG TPA: efflux RND transporter periplasmic adaptor subunit [Vicinamibacteria bacterium]|nr:efflux RND transporter periplasmic adaptor subunit [Vicinamibacteria bacterium]